MGFGRFGGGGRGGGDIGPKPVAVGDELDVTIEAVAAKGDGIAKKEGFVIFVPGVKVGEKVRIKVNAVKRTCAIAEKVGEASVGEASGDVAEAPSGEAPAPSE